MNEYTYRYIFTTCNKIYDGKREVDICTYAQEESLNLLDIEVILTRGKNIHSDIYWKDTNPRDYLNFHSAHPTLVKQRISFNLATRILVLVTKEDKMESRLRELRSWLLQCNYLNSLIHQEFYKAKLQGHRETITDRQYSPNNNSLSNFTLRTYYQSNYKL